MGLAYFSTFTIKMKPNEGKYTIDPWIRRGIYFHRFRAGLDDISGDHGLVENQRIDLKVINVTSTGSSTNNPQATSHNP